MMSAPTSGLSISPAARLITKPTTMNSASQVTPYSVSAHLLRQQAMRLKNRLLTGGSPCQCTSAGACQNSSDRGRYSITETHIALWKSVEATISRVILPPTR